MAAIDSYLRRLVELGGSDLHFLAGDPPRVRVNGDLRSLDDKPLDAKTAQELLEEILSPAARKALDDHDGADFAHDIEGVGRFRCRKRGHEQHDASDVFSRCRQRLRKGFQR